MKRSLKFVIFFAIWLYRHVQSTRGRIRREDNIVLLITVINKYGAFRIRSGLVFKNYAFFSAFSRVEGTLDARRYVPMANRVYPVGTLSDTFVSDNVRTFSNSSRNVKLGRILPESFSEHDGFTVAFKSNVTRARLWNLRVKPRSNISSISVRCGRRLRDSKSVGVVQSLRQFDGGNVQWMSIKRKNKNARQPKWRPSRSFLLRVVSLFYIGFLSVSDVGNHNKYSFSF